MSGEEHQPSTCEKKSKEMIDTLIQMGIDPTDAKFAVLETGCSSVEAAISWVFEDGARRSTRKVTESSRTEEGTVGDNTAGYSSDEESLEDYKMVFVVNSSLKMGVGKIAAQVGHAAVDLYIKLISSSETDQTDLYQWIENGSKKVVLSGNSTEDLLNLKVTADKSKIPSILISDAGKTQIPSGSHTIFALFGTSAILDGLTGKLKLLP